MSTGSPLIRSGALPVRCRYRVVGLVQGVGFRPFVHATATALGLSGTVANDSAGVVVEAEGDAAAVAELGAALGRDAPPLAVVERIESAAVAVRGGAGFRIVESRHVDGGRTLASPDVATCDDCLRELADPADRRYRHPFVTCTNCGPRFTIITDLPYDRPSTTMAGFPMCADCAREYADPADRRFHAQPIACPGCGPRLELVTGPDPVAGGPVLGEAALAGARALLAAGAVVAVKGLGGYHLACDATDEDAVATLRRRKARGAKPFAVMVPDLATAQELAVVGDLDAALLTGPRRPVVLVERRAAARTAPSVSPANPDLGLLLPYTPVHALLLGLPGDEPGPRVLVMTSGNLSGEPIVTDDADALVRLAGLADAWLRHDRPIRVPCDDSVTRVVEDAELPIRRSRGYAPLPVTLPVAVPPTLAVGADLKNTCAVGAGRHAWLSQHVGDMDDLRTLDAFGATQEHLRMLTGVAPTHLAADDHPLYRSTHWARRERGGRVLIGVQHHHAHTASVMAEHGLDGTRPVIGIAFDGTGYGSDGAVWGGEVLVADYAGFERIGHLGYVPLPGGDASVRRPYRMALAHLRAAGVEWTDDLPCVGACPAAERAVLDHQLSTGLGCVPTSSMGRLFDAVSALAGVCQVADHEGQAAVELEGAGRGIRAPDGYRFGEAMDPTPVVRAVAADVRAGVARAVVSARFHAAVVDLIAGVATTARAATGLSTVALSGGAFQNPTLLAGACQALRRNDFTVLRHRVVPPNDGGIALGQLMIAADRSRGLPCA
ncbi:MAG: carbamoyltransferase HypF [Pseudonocardia sp.]|nr:carbamoyltransferase HypF [Pseudonocardia sp.]